MPAVLHVTTWSRLGRYGRLTETNRRSAHPMVCMGDAARDLRRLAAREVVVRRRTHVRAQHPRAALLQGRQASCTELSEPGRPRLDRPLCTAHSQCRDGHSPSQWCHVVATTAVIRTSTPRLARPAPVCVAALKLVRPEIE